MSASDKLSTYSTSWPQQIRGKWVRQCSRPSPAAIPIKMARARFSQSVLIRDSHSPPSKADERYTVQYNVSCLTMYRSQIYIEL